MVRTVLGGCGKLVEVADSGPAACRALSRKSVAFIGCEATSGNPTHLGQSAPAAPQIDRLPQSGRNDPAPAAPAGRACSSPKVVWARPSSLIASYPSTSRRYGCSLAARSEVRPGVRRWRWSRTFGSSIRVRGGGEVGGGRGVPRLNGARRGGARTSGAQIATGPEALQQPGEAGRAEVAGQVGATRRR
jgi:hypothetical protein